MLQRSIILWIVIVALLIAALRPYALCAQSARFYNIRFTDSLILEENQHVLSGVIKYENVTTHPSSLSNLLILPAGWKKMDGAQAEQDSVLDLKAGEVRTIVFNLLKAKSIHAGWDSIRVISVDKLTTDTLIHYLHISLPPKPDFSLKLLNEEQHLIGERPEFITFHADLKNTGNVQDTIDLAINSQLFDFTWAAVLILKPGQDTALDIPCTVNKSAWNNLYTESISLKARDRQGKKERYFLYKVSKPRSDYNQTDKSANTMPITIGGGLLSMGSNITYFGQIRGQIKAGEHSLSFSYRSKELGITANTYQPNLFLLSYSYRHILVEAGQVQTPHNFFNSGQGISVSYHDNKGLSLSVAAMKYMETPYLNQFRNNNIYAAASYNIKRVHVLNRVESNFDMYYKVNSYLIDNELDLLHTKKISLRAFLGAGYEYSATHEPGLSYSGTGASGGYELQYNPGKFRLLSNVRMYSNYFPGIYRGLKNQQHDLMYLIKKAFIGVSVISNAVERNTLRDTLYNTDYLKINNAKYGLLGGYLGDRLFVTMRAGILQQKTTVYSLNNAAFFDADVRVKFGKNSSFNLGTYNAYKNQHPEKAAFVTNTYINLSTRYFGFTGSYNRIPEAGDHPLITSYVETVNGGPCVNFSFFRQALTGSLRYTVGKTLNEAYLRTGIGGQLNFRTGNGGLTIGMSGFYPLKDPTGVTLPVTELRYGSMYLYKRINVPVKRIKTYDIALTLFNDENNNGSREENEPLLDHAVVTIDGKTLVTDEKGTIHYNRVKPGVYKAGFLNTSFEDLIPSNGVVQMIELNESVTRLVAFRKGKKLSGRLSVDLDSLSNTTITPGNFKIIITDTTGKVYNTITDPKGDFYIFLPEGIYQVSLNPDAFANSDFKPDRMSRQIILAENKNSRIDFLIRQKKRKIRFLETPGNEKRAGH